MGWRQNILIVFIGICAVGAAEPHCTAEGRFPNPEACGSFFECVPSVTGGYDLVKDDCMGFRYNGTSMACSNEKCASRERRSVTTPYHAYSHLCEKKLNGFVCADCRSLVLCVKGQAFVRRCTTDRFCDMREDFGGGICYPKSPLECTCREAHTFFRDHYDSQKFFSCSGVGSSPTSYRCPDGMFFCEKTSQCRNKVGLPPCTLPGIFANPENCTEYYSCIALRHGWLQKSFACLNGTLFNERTGMCENPCPQAVCKEEGRFPDPLDKSCYYECFLDGRDMKSIRYQCPEGNVWHNDEKHCVLETEVEVSSPFAKCVNQLEMCTDDVKVMEPPVEDTCGSNPCYPGVSCAESSIYPFYICGPCPIGYQGDGVACQPLKCPYMMTGDGITCGMDTDADGFPDNELNCSYTKCRRDNCKDAYNPDQYDLDMDGVGDQCDSDRDGDGVENSKDNCPNIFNADQADQENDRVGDVCDNCPNLLNPGQEDGDQDFVGNVCDTDLDSDSDGVQDNLDNCPNVPNADQSDVDADKMGDACDTDADNDGIPNKSDNCVLVYNPDQKNTSSEVYGDACNGDLDGDGVLNMEDHCPLNPNIHELACKNPTIVNLLPGDPGYWEMASDMVTLKKSAAGSMVVGENRVSGMDFAGDFQVDNPWRNYIGLVFSYQSNEKFYIFLWKNETTDDLADRGVQLKVVDSATGPSGLLNDAVWKMGDTENQARLIWNENIEVGTNMTYKWLVQHRPIESLIRVVIQQGDRLVLDSGNIMDDTLKGGRVGVFSHSQMGVKFSNFKLICNDGPTGTRNINLPLISALHSVAETGSPFHSTFSESEPTEESEPPFMQSRFLGIINTGIDYVYKGLEAIKWVLQPGNAKKMLSKLEEKFPDTYDKIKDSAIWNMDPKNSKWALIKLGKIDTKAIFRIEIVVREIRDAPAQRGLPLQNWDGEPSIEEGAMEKLKPEGVKEIVGGIIGKPDSGPDEAAGETPVETPSQSETGVPIPPTVKRTSHWG